MFAGFFPLRAEKENPGGEGEASSDGSEDEGMIM